MCETGKLRAAGVREVMFLESTPMLRKYSSFIDAAWASLTHRCRRKGTLPCVCVRILKTLERK